MSDKVDDIAFNYTAQDNTSVDLFGMEEVDPRLEKIHDALMVAGFMPGLGNLADATDALLYAFEGEFGDAAISAAAMIPFVGQAVSTKKALKAAKESGEDMITFFRGIDEWHPGKMVQDGNWVGGGHYLSKRVAPKTSLWVTQNKSLAKEFMKTKNLDETSEKVGHMLEFQVPKSYVIENFNMRGLKMKDRWPLEYLNKEVSSTNPTQALVGYFPEGLPKEFLTKVHK